MNKRIVLASWTCIFIFTMIVTLEGRAEAYLDGGTGSMIFQVIVGGIAGIVLAIKLFWHKITQLFSGKKSADGEPK